MPVLVPAVGTISYNGVSFGAKTHLGIDQQPIEDEATRAVIGHVFTITIDTMITLDEAMAATARSQGTPFVDSKLEQLATLLSKPGAALIVEQQGFMALRVNVDGESVKDIDFGPKVKRLVFTPVGAARAANVKMTIETRIPVCDDAKYEKAIMALNYEVDWHIRDGITSRTISGYIEIPMTRSGIENRTPPDTVDLYRDRLANTVPPGFRRTGQNFHESKSKRRLDFAFVDEEWDSDNPPPDEAIEIDDSHSVRSTLREGFTQWTCNFQASIRVKRNASRQAQWTAFYTFLRDRIDQIVNAQLPDSSGLVGVIPLEYHFREGIHNRTLEFGISVRMTTSLEKILVASGLWRPYPAASGNWSRWATSLQNDTWALRGYANLASKAEDDVIVDLCGGEAKLGTGGPEPQKFAGRIGDLLGLPKPGPAESWLTYESYVVPLRTDSVVRHKLLQKPGPTKIGGPLEWLSPTTKAGMQIGAVAGADDVFQQYSTPTYSFLMVGQASRAAHKIPLPNVLKIGGQDPIQKVVHAAQKVIASAGDFPIYGAAWSVLYDLPNAPAGNIPFAPDHSQHIDPTLTGPFQ